MRWILWSAAAAGLVVLGGSMGASAQGMGGMGGGMGMTPAMGYGAKPRAYRPAPRAKPAPKAKKKAFGFRAAGPAAGSCGQFKYWSKGKCLDARTAPPKL